MATIFQYSTPHTVRLRRRTSDELLRGAHSRRAAGPTDVLETSINYRGISVYPSIHRMTQKIGLYDTSFRIAMDYEYFLRAYRAGATLCLHDHPPISVMRDTGISSKKDWASLRARFFEERRIHSKHANSPLLKCLYALYWPAYLGYRRIRMGPGGN